jgi:hypothetical protein
MIAIVWALIPDLSIALTGAIVGKGLIAHEQSPKQQVTAQQSQSSKSSRKSRSKGTAKQTSRARTMAEQIECKWHCGLSGTKAAMNAHSKFCSENPANQFAKVAQQSSR